MFMWNVVGDVMCVVSVTFERRACANTLHKWRREAVRATRRPRIMQSSTFASTTLQLVIGEY